MKACFNIRYGLPDEVWDKITAVCEKMPGWLGFGGNGLGEDGIPYWFGYDENEKTISASVEPSGPLFFATMQTAEWEEWRGVCKRIATQILGFEVNDIWNNKVGD